MQVLLDTSIVVDVLLRRKPWVAEAQALWQAVEEGRLTAYLTAADVTNILDVARRLTDLVRTRQAVQIWPAAFAIGRGDRSTLVRAQQLSGSDVDDNVSIVCAEATTLEAIAMRDPAGLASAIGLQPQLNPTHAARGQADRRLSAVELTRLTPRCLGVTNTLRGDPRACGARSRPPN